MKRTLNIRMLLNVIGGLLLLEAFFMIIPLVVSIYYNDGDWSAFAISASATALAGFFLRRVRTDSTRLGKREGFLLTSSVWLSFCVFGMLPFMLCCNRLDICSAFFEAMSGFTTTGATTLNISLHSVNYGIIMWQSLMQWLGGMGIIVFTLAIIPGLSSAGGVQMFNAEMTGITRDKLRPRIHQTAISLWGIYFILTVILAVLLYFGKMNVFEAVCHALCTISTGGFTYIPESLANNNSDYVLIITTIFMFLGGMSFVIIFRAVMLHWTPISKDSTLKIYIGSIFTFATVFALYAVATGGVETWRDVTIIPLFQVVSIITSTGYIAPNFPINASFIMALTLIMMFMGGCAGSTSGGAKIDRIVYLKKYLTNEIHRCLHPNAILAVRVNGSTVNSDLVGKTISFLCLFVLLIIGGGIVLTMLGLPMSESFFTALSCMCNTGIGYDFSAIPDAAKWLLAFLMLAGRLEIYTVLVLFTRTFWRK